MFERLKKAAGEVLYKMGIVKEMRDVVEVRKIPPLDKFYTDYIEKWKSIYSGYCGEWHDVKFSTVSGGRSRRMATLNAAKALCAELSGLVFNEECDVNVSLVPGKKPESLIKPDLQGFIDSVLNDNRFFANMQTLIEKCFAYGGAAVKAWAEDGNIRLDYVAACNFIPLSWDSRQVTEGVFLNKIFRDGFHYTHVEWHLWDEGDYVVKSELYRSDSPDALGQQAEPGELFPGLEETVRIIGLRQPLFVYLKPNLANNMPGQENSPLGVSVFANALDTLKALDICFDSFTREFVLGKKRIIVPASAVRTVADQNGELRRYFDASDEVYQAMAFEDPERMKIIDSTAELRVGEHVEAINALLSILAFQTGLTPGALSFDAVYGGGVKTATEVISENSKTFKTVKTHKNIIGDAVKRLVDIIVDLGQLYGMLPERLEYETSVTFDDSIVEDGKTDILNALRLVRGGLQSRFTTLVNLFGYTAEQARMEIERIKAEGFTDDDFLLFDNEDTGVLK